MPFHRGSSSTGRQSRVRTLPETLHAGARAGTADGVLVLYAEGGEPSARSVPKDLMSEDAVLAPLRAERDAALEEVAYLREQLRSLIAYHTHLLDEERRRMHDERTQVTIELATLREELQRRTYPGSAATRSARELLATGSDSDGASTR
jgi:hypothetical protein